MLTQTRIETLRKVRDNHFIHISMTFSEAKSDITIEGFIDKANKIFDLSYLNVNENEHGKGLGRLALQELKKSYSEINVYFIQTRADGFWAKMFAENLVNSLHREGEGLSSQRLKIWNSL